MLHTVLAWGMIAFGLLLIYDFISLGIRVGFGHFGRRYAVSPVLGAAVCALYGVQLAGGLYPALLDAFLTVAALVFLVGFAGYLWGTYRCVHRPPCCDWRYVVVLGAALRQRRNPSPLLKSRLEVGRLWWHLPFGFADDEARRLTHIASESPMPGAPQVELPAQGAAAARERFLVTSGGQGPDEDVPEAVAMRDYLVERGVPVDRILIDPDSRTTWENLANVKRLIVAREDAGTAGSTGAVPQTAMQAYAASRVEGNTAHRPAFGARSHRKGAGPAQAQPKGACLIVTNDFHALRTWLWAHRLHLPVAGVVGKPTRLYYLVGSLPRDYLAVLKGYKTEVVAVVAFLLAVCLLALL